MSGYGRRTPNVSQTLANLNHIPSQQEILQQQTELASLDTDLEFLANAEFFDFDHFNPPAAFEQQQPHHDAKNGALYQFNDFTSFPAATTSSPTGSITSLSGSLPGQFPSQSDGFGQSPVAGDKRKASMSMPLTADLEQASRIAAEEDKRRRNTAASARFRVKKKQREQALEKQAKEMTDKVSQLESKVQKLEMENKWLKELITEKNGIKSLETALNLKREKESEERNTGSRTDGVGTESKGIEGEA